MERNQINNTYRPFENLLAINMKMLKNFPFFDSANIKTPKDQFFEKGMDLFIDNSQKTIEYMQDIFQNFQSAWLECNKESLNAAVAVERAHTAEKNTPSHTRTKTKSKQLSRSKPAYRSKGTSSGSTSLHAEHDNKK